MKKIITRLVAMAAIAVLPVVSGCEKDNGKTAPESSLSFSESYVEAATGGGDYSMKYTIENPVDGVQPVAEAGAEWISSCTVDDIEVKFTVDANPDESARQADITVEYNGKTYSFEVRQNGKDSETVFELSSDNVNTTAAGGEYSIDYTITNPVDGAGVEAVTDAGWIGQFDMSSEGSIKFMVQENEGEARSASVNVTYAGIERSFTVNQKAAETGDGKTIDITIVDASTLNVVVSIIPSDKEMTYIAMFAEKSFIDGFASDEELFEDEMDYYTEQANGFGVDLATYLQYIVLFKGDNPSMPMAVPNYDTAYYAYAYGVNEEGITLETKVFKKEFTVPSN